MMDDGLGRLRAALRGVTRAPGFALTAIAILALGIGLSTAVFTIANAILIRRLPVANQDRLALLWGKTRDGSMPNVPFTLADIRAIERNSTTLEAVAFFPFRGATQNAIRVRDRVHAVQFALVSGNYFTVLGTRPALGRSLRDEDDVAGARPVVVLSYRAWQQRFGGDSAVIGQSMTVVQSGRSHTIVGVMPQGFEYPRETDVWAPVIAYSSAGGFLDIVTNELDILARLRPGVSHSDARSELSSYLKRPTAAAWHRNAVGVVHSLSDDVLGDTRPAIILIGLASALLLFISCVNVANLMLIRALNRTKELVVRSALGASRAKIVGQSLLESGVLASAAGLLGIAFAVAAVRGFVALAPNVPHADDITINETTLIATIATTAIAMFLSGLAPAMFAARVDANEVLRSGPRNTRGATLRLVLEGLVVAQIGLAVVTLTAAGLTARSFVRLVNADLSFDVDGLLVAPLTVASGELPDPTRARGALDLVLERLSGMPGVRSASFAYSLPFIGGGGGIDGRLSAPAQTASERERNPVLNFEIATPSYFATLGVRLLRGRAFTAEDREGSPRVVIVSASVARHFWPGDDPIGKRLVAPGIDVTVVGVVPDTRYRDLRIARSAAYYPLAQLPLLPSTLLIRMADAAPTSLPALRRVVEETSAGIVLLGLEPIESLLDEPRTNARLHTIVLGFFATSAVFLAMTGLFAIIATMVRQRTHELGIRLALGASASSIRHLVLGRGMSLAMFGGAVGIALSMVASRWLSSLLFEVRPTDIVTLVGVAVAMPIVAALATLVPVRSSMRIDPMIALRGES